jgi:L-threonylcarbamoyladenylate synthase
MEVLSNCTENEMKKAAKALKDSYLVAFPTETVYGLGADAVNETAVKRIYSIKGRPTNHPLIVHIKSSDQLLHWAKNIPDYALALAQEFWPGPMTLILRKTDLAKDFITGGQTTVGLRVPSHPVAQMLLKEFGKIGGLGISAPSANLFGKVSPTSGSDVLIDLGDYLQRKDVLIDAGPCLIGLESTIIECLYSKPKILRPGKITSESILQKIGVKVEISKSKQISRVPGSFSSHYSPKVNILVNQETKIGNGFLAMSSISTPKGAIRIASPKSVDEYAQVLYRSFRLCDELSIKDLVVVLPTGSGIATAIRDRVLKASH